MKSFDEFFEYFFSLGKGLCIFPNAYTRHFWTTYLAKRYHCISLEHFFTFRQFQQHLQAKILQEEKNSLRFLTSQETNIMLTTLLQNPQVQSLVLEIEQLKSLPNRKEFCDTLHKKYTGKLYQILNQHILYESFPSPLTQKIQAVLLLYAKLLSDYECIDSIVLSYFMKNKMLTQHTEAPFHLFLMCPDLFRPQDLLWFQYFGQSMSAEQGASASTMFLQTSYSLVEHIENKFFTYQRIEINPSSHVFQPFPDILQHKIDTQNTPLLHVYENSALEFENIFFSIRQLLSEGVPPHEISLMVCQYNQTVETELFALAQKYQIPFTISQSQKNLEHLLLSLLQETYNTHFNPEVLKRLFFEPCFPWKHRERNKNIVMLGLENSCINDKSLYQWKSILYKKEEDAKYFHFFVKCVRNIINSKDFTELYKNLELFGSSFFSQKMRALGTYDIDEHALINIILKECETLFSFEKYLNNQGQEESSSHKLEPWNILLDCFGNSSSTSSNKYSAIQVASFPHAIGTGHAYQFICNLSQKAIVQATSFRTVFNDYLSRAYNSEEIASAYKNYKHGLLDYINASSHAIYLSASIEGSDGVNILPIYWDIHGVAHIQDIWKDEVEFWNDEEQKSPEKLCVSNSQRHGLLYVKELGLENFSQSRSLTKKGFSEELYIATFPQNDPISIRATSASVFFNPEIFYLSEVLKLNPLFPEYNTSMNESLVWGTLYHQRVERALMERLHLFKDLQDKEDTDKNSQPSPEAELLQGMFHHPYIRETIELAFQNLNLEQHVECLQSILPQNHSSKIPLVTIEKNLETELNKIIHTISQNSEYKALIKNINPHITSAITIRGRADLLYKNSEKELYHIIDFKRANSKYNIMGLLQTWLYFIIVNSDFLHGQDTLCLLDKDNKSYGHLYFIAEDIDTGNHIYPHQENLKEQELLIIQGMPQAFVQGLSDLSQLYKGINTIQADSKKRENLTIESFREDEVPLYIKNILREGCYIYVK